MRSLSDTVARLSRLNARAIPPSAPRAGSVLTELEAFGDNPGELRALLRIPPNLKPGAALVVVLHGCTQTAAGYDRGSGWSALADRFGFAVLYAEQRRGNNFNLCFNWYDPADARRGAGEPLSIRDMVVTVTRQHEIDPGRIFVTGLSAGGAMTSVMLATYPELFAGGAIIAGLPYGVASTMPEAFDRMRGHGYKRNALGDLVRAASHHTGPWPTIAIWHGSTDHIVDAVNATMISDQWRDVHEVGDPSTHSTKGWTERRWQDASGRLVIEEHLIAGMDHGIPVATSGAEACGTAGPYMLDVGISSTYRIAASWGLVPPQAEETAASRTRVAAPAEVAFQAPVASLFDPERAINDALRAAGLLKP